MKAILTLPVILLYAAILTGCANNNSKNASEKTAGVSKESQASDNSTEQQARDEDSEQRIGNFKDQPDELVTDPNENAFSLRMPAGWKNEAWLYRVYELTRSVATSVSPDGKTVIFIGDPKMPSYFIPTQDFNANSLGAPQNPLAKFSQFVPAEQYLEQYVRDKFSQLEGFQIISRAGCPIYKQLQEEQNRKSGNSAYVSDACVKFDYILKGETAHGLLNCTTILYDKFWMAGVNGISSADDPEKYNDVIVKILRSHQANPQWVEQDRQMAQQRLEVLKQNHANNMATLNAMNERHQIRMNAIHSANDSYNAAWQQRQESNEQRQGQFLNMIREEHTVASSSGQTFQVDNSHQKYFVNKSDQSYIGSYNTTSLDDLRKMGVNPDDYEEVQIIR